MTKDKIEQTVKSSFDSAFSSWEKQIEKELYPDAFSDPHSWLRVKASIQKNNKYLEDALTKILVSLLSTE